MKKGLIFLFLVLMGMQAFAQRTYGRKNMPLVNLNGQYKLSGWHFAPGITYMANRFKNTPETLYESNDTTYNVTFDPAGKIGLYLEAGRYHIFKYGYLFAYMDYSLAFKKFKGTEKFTGEFLQEGSNTPFATSEGNGAFKHSYLTGNINLNNVVQLNDYEFWQNSLGLNIDYRIGGSSSYSGVTTYQNPNDPAKFMMQLHYRLGYGFKWTDRLFVIPMIETPILSVFSWDNGKSSYEMFSSRYRPLIFTIRFAWLRKSSWDCPPSEGGPNDKDKQQQYQQESR
jgi:hypothetical protein